MSKKEVFDLEAVLHLSVHLLGIFLLIWVAIFLPLWLAVLVLVVEIAQMKYFGRCILTIFAHKRGYMVGKTFWMYVPWLLGVKDYVKADKIISAIITWGILGILVFRLVAKMW